MGVGIDMCEVCRFERLLKNERFMRRVFSEREREYILSRGVSSPQTAAGIFCAKEAFSKAVGTGLSDLRLCEIEVLRDEKGAPFISLSGSTRQKFGHFSVELSITHTCSAAAAVVLL